MNDVFRGVTMQCQLLLVLLGAHAAWKKTMLQHSEANKGHENPPHVCQAELSSDMANIV